MISLAAEFADGICPTRMMRAADRACQWYSHNVHEKHLLQVVLVNAPLIVVEGDDSHGSFWYEEDSKEPDLFVIQIASNLEGMGKRWQAGVELMLKTLFHEFAHYEQCRDGRKVQERGVNVRASNLYRKYIEDSE